MGDWILFRGRRRFVVLEHPGGVVLKRVRPGRRNDCAFYSVGPAEKIASRVIKRSTPSARSRAKRLLEARCMPWTTIVWNGDTPTYRHDGALAKSPW